MWKRERNRVALDWQRLGCKKILYFYLPSLIFCLHSFVLAMQIWAVSYLETFCLGYCEGCDKAHVRIEALREVTLFSDLSVDLFQQETEPSSFPGVTRDFAGLAAR